MHRLLRPLHELPRLVRIAATLGALFTFLSPLPAAAQNMSDVSGVTVTNSTVIGGSFSPVAGRPIMRVETHYELAVETHHWKDLLAGELLLTSTDSLAADPSIADREVLECALLDRPLLAETSCAACFVGRFTRYGFEAGAARRLFVTIRGIIAHERPRPEQLIAAVAAYNDLVERAPEPFLRNPSPIFLTVGDLLRSLSEATHGH